MRFKEWKSLWGFEREVEGKSFALTLTTPYAFVRVLWHYCPQTFKAWPNAEQTGYVYGWRWPWKKQFKETGKVQKHPLPVVAYKGPVDFIYLARMLKDIGVDARNEIGGIVRQAMTDIVNSKNERDDEDCAHNAFFIPSCEGCARKAARVAIRYRMDLDAKGQALEALTKSLALGALGKGE